jgi:hypothetical protein|tara:strand:- start:353 stop:2323 length:1971 start_codon:yes stop_codon:yes gene_type:complete
MGAYESPDKLIDDKSIMLEAQGVQGFAQGIAQGITAYGQGQARLADKLDKIKKANDLKDEKRTEQADEDIQKLSVSWEADDPNNPLTKGTIGSVLSNAATGADNVDSDGKPIMNVIDAMKGTDSLSKEIKTAWNSLMGGFGSEITNISEVTEILAKCKTCDKSLTNSMASEMYNGKGVTTTPKIAYNRKTKSFDVSMTYSSETIGEMNKILGLAGGPAGMTAAAKLGDSYTIQLNGSSLRESSNPNVTGFIDVGLFGVEPVDTINMINDGLVSNSVLSSNGNIDPEFITTSETTGEFLRENFGDVKQKAFVNSSYVDLNNKNSQGQTLYGAVMGSTNLEADTELGLEDAHLPIIAKYNSMEKQGLLQRGFLDKDGLFTNDPKGGRFLPVRGYYKDGIATPYASNGNVRLENGDLRMGTVMMSIPDLVPASSSGSGTRYASDPNTRNIANPIEEPLSFGDNFFEKAGVDGFKTVMLYEGLAQTGYDKPPEIENTTNRNWAAGLSDVDVSELNFDVVKTFNNVTTDPDTAAGGAGYTIDTDEKGRVRLVDKAIGESEITSKDIYDAKGNLTKAKNATQYFDFTNQKTGKGDYIDFNKTLFNENKFLPNVSAETTGLKNEYRALIEAKWDRDFKGNVTSMSTPFVPSPERPPLTQITNR